MVQHKTKYRFIYRSQITFIICCIMRMREKKKTKTSKRTKERELSWKPEHTRFLSTSICLKGSAVCVLDMLKVLWRKVYNLAYTEEFSQFETKRIMVIYFWSAQIWNDIIPLECFAFFPLPPPICLAMCVFSGLKQLWVSLVHEVETWHDHNNNWKKLKKRQLYCWTKIYVSSTSTV